MKIVKFFTLLLGPLLGFIFVMMICGSVTYGIGCLIAYAKDYYPNVLITLFGIIAVAFIAFVFCQILDSIRRCWFEANIICPNCKSHKVTERGYDGCRYCMDCAEEFYHFTVC